ncbi:RHS repeat-associated core domain-containing protein [Methylocaldum sp. BRCS4]|nr:RHS repeat-associated core domain-containing protein [Methylocaldum sp. BRCS4]
MARLTGSVGSPSATASYYHPDGLGSLLALTSATGAVTATQRFDAFGQKFAGSGTVPTYGYTGREPDANGLVYYRARYYDPSIGRFTQRDPVGYLDGINRYAYMGNNPVNFTDPNGLLARQVSVWATQQANYFKETLNKSPPR